MKLIDCFTFYNEIQLLTYRLALLNDLVDYFIIVEATHTHAGNEKELYFEKNKDLFSKYLPKIIHIVVDDFQYKQPTIDFSKEQQWDNERFQRKCISRGVDKLNLLDEDLLMISDLDEIPDPNTLTKIKNNEIKITLNSLEQDLYYYNLNCQVSEKWPGTKILTYMKFLELNVSCNDIRHMKSPIIPNGGWHLSYFGDSTFIQNKMLNFSHQEYSGDIYRSIDNIKSRLDKNTDPYNRCYIKIKTIAISENEYLPPMYTNYLKGFF